MLVDDKQAREKERIANDLCQWCEGYTVKEIFSEALQEYANFCLRENLIRSVEIAAEKDERIESLSAQVAELTEKLENLREATSTKRLLQLSNQYDGQILRAAAAEAQVAELKKDAERMHGLIEQLAGRFRGYLPWLLHDSVVRGHATFIKDTISKADAILAAKESGVSP